MRGATRTEGMITDPVCEGKSMAGLIDLVARAESLRLVPISQRAHAKLPPHAGR